LRCAVGPKSRRKMKGRSAVAGAIRRRARDTALDYMEATPLPRSPQERPGTPRDELAGYFQPSRGDHVVANILILLALPTGFEPVLQP